MRALVRAPLLLLLLLLWLVFVGRRSVREIRHIALMSLLFICIFTAALPPLGLLATGRNNNRPGGATLPLCPSSSPRGARSLGTLPPSPHASPPSKHAPTPCTPSNQQKETNPLLMLRSSASHDPPRRRAGADSLLPSLLPSLSFDLLLLSCVLPSPAS